MKRDVTHEQFVAIDVSGKFCEGKHGRNGTDEQRFKEHS